MSTVAEGIETPGQAALMLDLRCTRGQGYLYGRPMEAAALEAWLSQRDAAAPREFAETA
jgi:EAL domain-containing protein (putative c-di-GMP-specific phosphodiesterase class I)